MRILILSALNKALKYYLIVNYRMELKMNAIKWLDFLKDVFICSLGSYGGPEAHFAVFTEQLVVKKSYLSEEELLELIALTGILPGPSSTQTMIAIGYKIGGPVLGFLTMLVWSLPVLVIMTALSFMSGILTNLNLSKDVLRYIGPMAVGFVVVAAYRMSKKVLNDRLKVILMLAAAIISYFIRTPWVFPMLLLSGGMASIISSQEKAIWQSVKLSPPWGYLAAFSIFALGGLTLSFIWDEKLIKLFESFYRYGYLVIGGGQVVVPMMYTELVEVNQYMTNQEFLSGFGLVQGLPGPMFSFSAYAGGMAARGQGVLYQIMGAIAGGIGIFLPGILLIYFVYPIWEGLKKIRAIKISLSGIVAVAAGLITASALVLMQRKGFSPDNILISLITIVLLMTKKVPAPIIVLLSLLAGVLL